MEQFTALLFALTIALSTSTAFSTEPSETQLIKQAKVTRAQAERAALARVPQGTIKSGEIEREYGKLIWSFDIAQRSTKNITEVQVDALTGKIASVQTETPKDQAKESAAEHAKK